MIKVTFNKRPGRSKEIAIKISLREGQSQQRDYQGECSEMEACLSCSRGTKEARRAEGRGVRTRRTRSC